MIVYPTANYNSFISEAYADTYFNDRLNAGRWDATTSKEAALVTAFRSLQELDIVVDLTDTDALQALKDAQCEQALHELVNDLDGQAITGLQLGGLLNVKIPASKTPPPRYSPRALNILRPYLQGRSIARTR